MSVRRPNKGSLIIHINHTKGNIWTSTVCEHDQ